MTFLSPRFALIGASGYVAPRHLKAIQANGGQLMAALDPHDAAGVLDAYFPQAAFFTEFERFDRHLEKEKRKGQPIDYVSVCSPNYLHDAHSRYALRYGADVVCEKPLVLNPHNLDALQELEQESGHRVWSVLQLRHHPHLLALKNLVEKQPLEQVFDVDLTYITPRGQWYYASWKGEPAKSGGIITNIGIHLFDMLLWVFGPLKGAEMHLHTQGRAAGYLELQRARVRWFLSIEAETLEEAAPGTSGAHRSLRLDGQDWDFSDGFTDLHAASYHHILTGQGWGIYEAKAGISLTWQLRHMPPQYNPDTAHRLAGLPPLPHPFQ